MDKRVFLLVLIILILGGALVLIRMFIGGCEPMEISYSPQNPMVGEEVTFTCDAEDTTLVSWTFGDGTTQKGGMVKHSYSSPQDYSVFAQVKEDCVSESINVKVLPKREMETVSVMVDLPDSILVGQEVTFFDRTPEAASWNWQVMATDFSGNANIFTTTFKRPGRYKLVLNVQGKYINGSDTFDLVVKAGKIIEIDGEDNTAVVVLDKFQCVKIKEDFKKDFKQVFIDLQNKDPEAFEKASDDWMGLMSRLVDSGQTIIRSSGGTKKLDEIKVEILISDDIEKITDISEIECDPKSGKILNFKLDYK